MCIGVASLEWHAEYMKLIQCVHISLATGFIVQRSAVCSYLVGCYLAHMYIRRRRINNHKIKRGENESNCANLAGWLAGWLPAGLALQISFLCVSRLLKGQRRIYLFPRNVAAATSLAVSAGLIYMFIVLQRSFHCLRARSHKMKSETQITI